MVEQAGHEHIQGGHESISIKTLDINTSMVEKIRYTVKERLDKTSNLVEQTRFTNSIGACSAHNCPPFVDHMFVQVLLPA